MNMHICIACLHGDHEQPGAVRRGAVCECACHIPDPTPKAPDFTPRRALFNRATRLLKLLEANAPDSVLGAEAWLIMRAALALSPTAAGSMIDTLITDARRGLGLCAVPKCENRLPDRDRDTSFELCEHHARKQAEADKKIDQLAQDLGGEI